jgi:hypothetical protein
MPVPNQNVDFERGAHRNLIGIESMRGITPSYFKRSHGSVKPCPFIASKKNCFSNRTAQATLSISSTTFNQ